MKQALLCAAVLLAIPSVPSSHAQTQSSPGKQPPISTLRVTSSLVFLDVTVLDRKGRPIVTGLSKDDFFITEDKKPQRIFSFEAPDAHANELAQADNNPDGRGPATIFVLDLLNSRFTDFAYIRYEVKRYLKAQPGRLSEPAELMVLGNQSLDLVQGWTRSKEDLLDALDHVPAALPYKMMSPSFWPERFDQSLQALQEIALQNKGVPGRKNIVWVGHGGPGLNTAFFPGSIVEKLNRYVHGITNMLVNARISLFVIYPGLPVRGASDTLSTMDSAVDLGDNDPFAGDINFGIFVNETGGKLFYNRNDIDQEMRQSQLLGSEYYTLTYQPHDVSDNGRFRRIRVTLRDPNLRALTKTGYFAADSSAPVDAQQRSIDAIAGAAQATIPLDGLNVTVGSIVRHPDSEAAQFTVNLQPRNLQWLGGADGNVVAKFLLAAVSLDKDRKILAFRLESWISRLPAKDPTHYGDATIRLSVVLRIPRQTRSVRLVVESEPEGRMGTVEVGRKTIEAAPATPTPDPQLSPGRGTPPSGVSPAGP